MHRGPKNYKHIRHILKNLRDEDRQELIAKFGQKYLKPVFKEIKKVDVTIVYKEKEPVLMYGVWAQEVPSRSLGGYKKEYAGIVWMLSTSDIEKDLIQFLRESKKEINNWSKQYRMLCNVIYKGNSQAIGWLKWLGFKFKDYTEDFIFFYKEDI